MNRVGVKDNKKVWVNGLGCRSPIHAMECETIISFKKRPLMNSIFDKVGCQEVVNVIATGRKNSVSGEIVFLD